MHCSTTFWIMFGLNTMLRYSGMVTNWQFRSHLHSELFGISEQLNPATILISLIGFFRHINQKYG